MVINTSKLDKIVDILLYVLLGMFTLATLFPLYYVFVISITPYSEYLGNGGFTILPATYTMEAYRFVLNSPIIPQAIKITITVTVLGTICNLLVTILLAYPLSKRAIPFRSHIMFGIVFTMLFSGGMIPLYLIVRATGLLNSLGALIIPGLISTFYMLVVKAYFENLPAEIEEAAKVDGCGEFQTLFRIVLPMSMPIFATIGLFYGVSHWNAYFPGIMYLSDRTLYPLQVVLRNMIQTSNVSQELMLEYYVVEPTPPQTIKMATVTLAILPVLVVYPFLQRFFVKGMLLGAIKG